MEQAKAAKTLIITCEELLDDDYLKNAPDRNQIPFIHANAVVHMPYGAYPTACFRYYDYDPVYLKDYAKKARDDRQYHSYIEQSILKNSTHRELLDSIGRKRLETISADKNLGYAKNLDRR
jgi:glutaconate CoA-transferase subunit A